MITKKNYCHVKKDWFDFEEDFQGRWCERWFPKIDVAIKYFFRWLFRRKAEEKRKDREWAIARKKFEKSEVQ